MNQSVYDSPKPPRIFLGLNDACGYFTKLGEGFSSLGAVFYVFENTPHPYGYSRGKRRPLAALMQNIYARAQKAKGWRRVVLMGMERFCKLILLTWAVKNFDYFIFSFGDSFFGYREFPLLKFCGKKIVMVYHGNDTRPPYCGGFLSASGSPSLMSDQSLITRTQIIRKEVAKVEAYADAIVCHTACAQFFSKPIVTYLAIGIPCALPPNSAPSPTQQQSSGPIKIVHAPSCPKVKGSDTFRAVVAKLQKQGHRIEYIEIIGMTNSQVMQALAGSDFALDQLYSDTPMATFATEAAAHGKPTVVAGYNYKTLLDEHRCPLPPSEFCHPDEIENAIVRLLDPKYRLDLGRRAREFVENEWSAKKVAERFLRLFDDEIPSDWKFDPTTSTYLFGAGISSEELRVNINRLAEKFGPESLGLTGKPGLEKTLKQLLNSDAPTENDAT